MSEKGKSVKKRIMTSVTDEVYEYYQAKADGLGISLSVCVFMALYQQMDMEKGIKALGKGDFSEVMTDIYRKLDEES